jgi:hypothetical protein
MQYAVCLHLGGTPSGDVPTTTNGCCADVCACAGATWCQATWCPARRWHSASPRETGWRWQRPLRGRSCSSCMELSHSSWLCLTCVNAGCAGRQGNVDLRDRWPSSNFKPEVERAKPQRHFFRMFSPSLSWLQRSRPHTKPLRQPSPSSLQRAGHRLPFVSAAAPPTFCVKNI